MNDDDLRRRFRTLDRVSAPDIWREVESQHMNAATTPISRFSAMSWPVTAAVAAALLLAAVVAGLIEPMLESRIGADARRPADAPFAAADVHALGVLPGDVPDLGWSAVAPDDPDATERVQSEIENSDAAWREHVVDHGLQGRWQAALNDLANGTQIVSTVSIWASVDDASEAFAYESHQLDRAYGVPGERLSRVAGLVDEGWCDLLTDERATRRNSFCFFRVGNATTELWARVGNDPYPLAELQEVARALADRSQALQQSANDLGDRVTVEGEVVVASGTPVTRGDIVVGCRVTGTSADIDTGMAVLVRDKATDELLAQGALNVTDEVPDEGGCVFAFQIPLVPPADMYSIRLEGRDVGLTYSRAALEDADWQVETMEFE